MCEREGGRRWKDDDDEDVGRKDLYSAALREKRKREREGVETVLWVY
jgi:hypothetical protein